MGDALSLGSLGLFIKADTKDFDEATARTMRKVQATDAALVKLGLAAGAVLAGGLGLGAMAIKTAAQFEAGMSRVAAVSIRAGQDTERVFKALKMSALDLAAKSQFTAQQVAEGMSAMGMAGMEASSIVKTMPSVLQLASAGMMDLGSAANITTNVLSGMGMDLAELGGANDVIVKAMTTSNVSVASLGEAFKMVGPVAKASGVSFATVTAALGKLGNAGIPATMAGTTLRGAFSAMLNPTKAAQEALDKLGIVTTTSGGKLRDFSDIVSDFEKSGASTGDMLQIFGQRAGPGMLAMMEVGGDALKKYTTELEASGGIAKELADKQMATLSGQFQIFGSQVERIAIDLGNILLPAIKAIMHAVSGMLNVFIAAPQWIKATALAAGVLVTALAGLITAAIAARFAANAFTKVWVDAGRAMWQNVAATTTTTFSLWGMSAALLNASASARVFGNAMKTASLKVWAAALPVLIVLGKVLLIIAAVVAAVFLLVVAFGALRRAWAADLGGIRTLFENTIGVILNLWKILFIGIKDIFDGIMVYAKDAWQWVAEVAAIAATAVGEAFDWIGKKASAIWGGVVDVVSWASTAIDVVGRAMAKAMGSVFDWIGDKASGVWQSITEGVGIAMQAVLRIGKWAINSWLGLWGTDIDSMIKLVTGFATVVADAWDKVVEGIKGSLDWVGENVILMKAFVSGASPEEAYNRVQAFKKGGGTVGAVSRGASALVSGNLTSGVAAAGKDLVGFTIDSFKETVEQTRKLFSKLNSGTNTLAESMGAAALPPKPGTPGAPGAPGAAGGAGAPGGAGGDAGGALRAANYAAIGGLLTDAAKKLVGSIAQGAQELATSMADASSAAADRIAAEYASLPARMGRAADAMADSAGKAAKAFGDTLLQASGEIGTFITQVKDGFTAGGIAGGLAAIAAYFVTKTKSFKEFTKFAADALESIAPLFEKLAAALKPIAVLAVDLLVVLLDLLMPVFDALVPVLQIFFVVVKALVMIIFKVIHALGSAWNSIVNVLISFLDWLGIGTGWLSALKINMNGIERAMETMNASTAERAAEAGKDTDSMGDAAAAADELSQSLSNAASGYKANLRRFQASEGAPGSTIPQEGVQAEGALTLVVQVLDPEDFVEKIENMGRFKKFMRDGTSAGGRPYATDKAGA